METKTIVKPVYTYLKLESALEEGYRVSLTLAEDHPCCSTRFVTTSNVVAILDDGAFETRNSVYKPAKTA